MSNLLLLYTYLPNFVLVNFGGNKYLMDHYIEGGGLFLDLNLMGYRNHTGVFAGEEGAKKCIRIICSDCKF